VEVKNDPTKISGKLASCSGEPGILGCKIFAAAREMKEKARCKRKKKKPKVIPKNTSSVEALVRGTAIRSNVEQTK